MKLYLKSFIIIFCILYIISCDLSGPDNVGFIDQNLKGEIRNSAFEFQSGVAVNSSDNWLIKLYPSDPLGSYNPWEPEAYSGTFPYLAFLISKNSAPRKYKVALFGTDVLVMNGWIDAFNGTFYDIGEVEILTIDLANNRITGRVWGDTKEKNSAINGHFSVVIEH